MGISNLFEELYNEFPELKEASKRPYLFRDKNGEPIKVGDSFTYLARQEPPIEYTVKVERIKNRVWLIFNDGRKIPFTDFFYGPIDRPLITKIREESQLDMGKNVEKEHEPTVKWVKDEVESTGEVPANKEIYASIAKDHLNEFPAYYTALDKMEQELKEDDEIQELNEGSVGTFIKGVGQKIGQSTSNALGKIPLIKAGQQAVQQSATSEAVLQASDMKGYLENILNALRNYVNNKAPQTTAPTQPQQVTESFKLTESLLTFELEHLTEAMDQPTFQKLVAAYVKTVEDDPLKILQNPAYLNQLRGIFNGSKRFGLTLPVSLKDFERVIAEYSKTGPATNQAPVAGSELTLLA